MTEPVIKLASVTAHNFYKASVSKFIVFNNYLRPVMTEYEFNLHLSADEYLQYYEGLAKFIQVRSHCGKTLQFPADKMRQFVLKDGIHGSFIIQLNDNNKFVSIRRA